MTPEREHKRVQRALRTIPVDSITPVIVANETACKALYCLIDGVVLLVSVRGGEGETTIEDPLEEAQFVRWLQAHPERVHQTRAQALAFVRSQLGWSE